MGTPYEKIYTKFLKRIEDTSLPSFTREEQIAMLTEWLDTAMSYIELDCLELKNDLSNRDNDLQDFGEELTVTEQELIAMYMVVAWYEPRINSLETTLMFVGSKDEKWTAQKDQLKMQTEKRDYWKSEARKYFRNYCYQHNSYLDGGNS